MNIAVIPARGGSKRVPRKNIRPFCGKPMITWSIDAAKASGLFAHVIVSTDEWEIADVGRACGAEVPFMRPAGLSDDHANTTEVIAHATKWAMEQGWLLNAVCCIYATAPFVEPSDLKVGLDLLNSGDWQYAFTATEYPAPIFRAFKRLPDGGTEMFFPEHFKTRSQDLPAALHDAGQFYWGKPSAWLDGKRVFDRHSTPIVIPKWRVQDIDDEDDWTRAELVFSQLRGGSR
jgi:N-acylneuraminate cytidylyltransferase